MRALGHFKTLATVAAVVSMSAASAFAQGANTAYVPFVVNANATVTAVQGAAVVSITVTANEEKVLILPRGITSVLNPGGMQERLNAPMVTGSRGNITLRLPPQSYQNAEISLHSVNGKRVLRAKAVASETGSAISRRNVAAGAYLLSVKGTNGGAFTTRLTHGGGDLSISVVFGTGSVSPERRLEKQAADGDWGITVVADGYIAKTYTLRAVVGINEKQVITLDPAPQAQTYTITFNQNYTGAPAVTTVRTGTDGKLASLPTPTRSGYTFNGWWTVSAATGGTQVTTSMTFSADATVYARWTAEPVTPPSGSTFTDSRDGKTYKKVVIGTQTWMGENLNYNNVSYSKCYAQDDGYSNYPDYRYCEWLGRLYDWATAMNLSRGYNEALWSVTEVERRGICPAGWHLPSDAEWAVLTDYVGGASTAGTKLKATSRWRDDGKRTDQYGFSALPGGRYLPGALIFDGIYGYGYWWSSTEASVSSLRHAWGRSMRSTSESVIRESFYEKSSLFSVRCVQDE